MPIYSPKDIPGFLACWNTMESDITFSSGNIISSIAPSESTESAEYGSFLLELSASANADATLVTGAMGSGGLDVIRVPGGAVSSFGTDLFYDLSPSPSTALTIVMAWQPVPANTLTSYLSLVSGINGNQTVMRVSGNGSNRVTLFSGTNGGTVTLGDTYVTDQVQVHTVSMDYGSETKFALDKSPAEQMYAGPYIEDATTKLWVFGRESAASYAGDYFWIGVYGKALDDTERGLLVDYLQHWIDTGAAPGEAYPKSGSFGPVSTSDPNANIIWECKRDDGDGEWHSVSDPLFGLSDAEVFQSNGAANDTLHIVSAQESDAGEIRCRAETAYSPDPGIITTATLSVKPLPAQDMSEGCE